MRILKYFFFIISFGAFMTACSSSPPPNSESGDGAPPPADAGTDAVPQASAENPQPSNDGVASTSPNGSPTDPAAAPAADPGAPPADPNAAAAPATNPGTQVANPGAPADNTMNAAAAPPAAPEQVAPASNSATVQAASPAVNAGETVAYAVETGDTLMKVAFETYGDLYRWKEIYEANKDKIADPNNLIKGVTLSLKKPDSNVTIERNGEKYLIKRGDTLGKISNEVYGTKAKWKKIWKNNKQLIKNPNRIFAGFHLYYIPEAPVPPQEKELTPAPMASNGATNSAPANNVAQSMNGSAATNRMPAAVVTPQQQASK